MRFAKIWLAVVVIFAAAAVVAQTETPLTGVVYQTTNVRSGPDTRFEIVGQLSEGDIVQVTGRDTSNRWLQVVMPTAEIGWLPVFALVIDGDVEDAPLVDGDEANGTSAPDAQVSVISYGRVNVRSGPGIGYEIVGQLDVGEAAAAIARSNRQNDWLLIQLGDDDEATAEGWVAYFTVNVQGDPYTLPVLVPDSSGEALIPPSRLLRALFNVRLHDTPDLESPVTLIIPFDSEVTPLGRSVDGEWLFVGYEDENGWGVTQLFDISGEELQALPVYAADVAVRTPTPTRTRAATISPSAATATPQATTAPTLEPTAEATTEP